MKKGITYTVIFILIISFVFVFFLSLANELTKDLTEKNAELALRRTILTAFNIPYSGNEAYSLYDEKIEIVRKDDIDLYMYTHQGTTEYGILFSGMALWGQVRGILSVNEKVTVITGLEFLDHNETPGLGGRIDEEMYKKQFRGEILNKDGMIFGSRQGVYDYDSQNSIVDGITGASRTSESIIIIVNRELSRLRTLLGEH